MWTLDKPTTSLSAANWVVAWLAILLNIRLYIAQYIVHWTAQRALHFSSPDRPVPSDTNSTSLGSIIAMPQLRSTFPHTVYSQVLIHTAEWTGASWRERKCSNFETVTKGRFEPGLTWLRMSTFHRRTTALHKHNASIMAVITEMLLTCKYTMPLNTHKRFVFFVVFQVFYV